MDIVKRFLNYVSYDTQSDENSDSFPSSKKQLLLLSELASELKVMGLNVTEKNGYVYGKLKSDSMKNETLFLMAHVDTSPDAKGSGIKPRIVHFTGENIILNENRILKEDIFPDLINHRNHDLIVTDGKTLLGADDKAGIAIIMDSLEKVIDRGCYPNIVVCFTPDEEIGRGTKNIDVKLIKNGEKTIYAYTVDGGVINELNYENFNAAHATVTVKGTSIHPSIGKGRLINAQEVLMQFHSLLPKERPENTENREPFVHLTGSKGSVEEASFDYIIRNFNKEDLIRQKNDFYKAKDIINEKYGKNIVDVLITDTYFNMREIIDKNPAVVDLAHKAISLAGLEPIDQAIRGGTDGATLSYLGLPCPNLGTGGSNFHGVFEYLDIDDMKVMVKIVMNLMDSLK